MQTAKIEKLRKDFEKTQHDINIAYAEILCCTKESKELLLDKPGPLTAAEKEAVSVWRRRLNNSVQNQEKLYARLQTQLGILETLKSAK